MNSHVHSICHGSCLFSAVKPCVIPFCVEKKFGESSLFEPVLRDLARILITEIAKVSAPKNKEKAPAAGESGNQRPKRTKDKLIRLNDLVPKQDVTGGHQLLFGATDETSTNNPTKDR
jgi:hypothetical protein